jgi:hypothetical protein
MSSAKSVPGFGAEDKRNKKKSIDYLEYINNVINMVRTIFTPSLKWFTFQKIK